MKKQWKRRAAVVFCVAVIAVGITAVPDARAQGGWGLFFVQEAECHYVCIDPETFECCVHEPLEPIIVDPDEP